MKSLPKILIVDDDERWRLALRNLLSEYSVFDSDGEEQALQAIASQYFDLVLLDYRLGEGDGLSIIRRASEMALRVGAIIIVTGFPDATLSAMAMKLGAVDFFNKGELKDLRARVQQVLARQSD